MWAGVRTGKKCGQAADADGEAGRVLWSRKSVPPGSLGQPPGMSPGREKVCLQEAGQYHSPLNPGPQASQRREAD